MMSIGGYDPRQTNRLSPGGGMEGFAPDVQEFDPIANTAEMGFLSPEMGEANLAIAQRQSSQARTGMDRKAAFRRAFASARAAGLKEFEFEGARFNTRLAGEAPVKAVPVPVPVPVKDKRHGDATMLPPTVDKKTYDAMLGMTSRYTTAPALNTAPVPEDAMERAAIGAAGSDYGVAWGMAGGLAGLGRTLAQSVGNKALSMGRLAQGNLGFMTRGQTNLAMEAAANARTTGISNAFRAADAVEMDKVLARLYRTY